MKKGKKKSRKAERLVIEAALEWWYQTWKVQDTEVSIAAVRGLKQAAENLLKVEGVRNPKTEDDE